jgi:para-nitrobenzyl esterase
MTICYAFPTLLSLFLSLTCIHGLSQPIVQTSNGAVRGHSDGTAVAFLGIPYARPPVDSLRWLPPRPVQNWSDTLNATNFGSPCLQKEFSQNDPNGSGTLRGSENCLFLNIWTSSPNTAANLPVMFFIHGGGNQQGSASDTSGGVLFYNGRYLAERENVVVVTINYRLGPLGYLTHVALDARSPTGKSGNFGTQDIVAALRWVRQNIRAFGGDTSRVMVFGESAGAVNTSMMLVTPSSAGLFSRALVQSGAPSATPYNASLQTGLGLVDSLGLRSLTPAAQLDSLRRLPAASLVQFLRNPTQNGIIRQTWSPTIDGVVIPQDPLVMIRQGQYHRVPVVVGSNADESNVMAPQTVTPNQVRGFFSTLVPPPLISTINALYPVGTTNSEARVALVQALTDVSFTATARRMMRGLNQTPASNPTYRYFFSKIPPPPFASLGAFHGLELFYVFQTLQGSNFIVQPADTAVMATMRGYWTQFARTGNPNRAGLPTWSAYQSATDPYIDINAITQAATGLRTAKCDLWDSISTFASVTPLSASSPKTFALDQNYPNPFNPSTGIRYQVSEISEVHLDVFDLLGRRVATLVNERQATGLYQVNFNAASLASGVYFYKLTAGTFTQTRKMMLIK